MCLLVFANLKKHKSSSTVREHEEEERVRAHENPHQNLLLIIYSSPEVYPALYSYAKALETIESSLLGGFYYKHFMLANNVIGSTAKGTMNKSVQALRSTYETLCFPGIH